MHLSKTLLLSLPSLSVVLGQLYPRAADPWGVDEDEVLALYARDAYADLDDPLFEATLFARDVDPEDAFIAGFKRGLLQGRDAQYSPPPSPPPPEDQNRRGQQRDKNGNLIPNQHSEGFTKSLKRKKSQTDLRGQAKKGKR